MKFYEIERIKKALGLPASSSASHIEAKIFELRDMEERLKGGRLPPEERPELPRQEEASLVSELRKMEYEPLLPVEKKLIVWSIVLGLVLLVFFVWVSYTYFPGTH